MTKQIFRPRCWLALWLCLLLLALPATTASQQRPATRSTRTASAAHTAAHPKLVVVFVVDQFRYDFLERFGDLFGKDGFRRLMNQGAVFTNANYDYMPTFTACGHAAIFSGSVPAQNGIVGNAYFDRASGKVRIMVMDDDAHQVTSPSAMAHTGGNGNGNGQARTQVGAPSPRSLIGTTIGDQMRLANNFQSKVIAVSYKDRSAVLPGGQRPNGAFWFDGATGTFVSSDYYFKELPAWVNQFNSTNRPDKYFGKQWDRALAPEAYRRAQSDYLPLQRSPLGTKFPYTITGGETKPGAKFYGAFELTPFASEYLAEFAKAALEAESLGADQFPDLLSISFSGPDLIGHSYGPDSQEVEDTYIRLDRVIADFLNYLDRRVGLANTLIAVSGDHGVAPIPEYARTLGFDAERIQGSKIIEAVNQALRERFGGDKWVVGFTNDQLYLDRKQLAERKADAAEAERLAGEAALTVSGVINYFTRTQINEGRMPTSAMARRVMNGFQRQRSGDVWIITKPFSFVGEGVATTHGTGYNYDTHVPVIFFGAGVRAGRYHIACSPSDIAPTLASMLGIEMPSNRVGRVLTEAITTPTR